MNPGLIHGAGVAPADRRRYCFAASTHDGPFEVPDVGRRLVDRVVASLVTPAKASEVRKLIERIEIGRLKGKSPRPSRCTGFWLIYWFPTM
ncbi:MAG TPA: hypothetical protein VGN80_05725 [Devosiaceae bacterium]|jgi:hypothetical protein|nr:hypothetical protein [Devosiaceae bacterium]